MCSALKPSMIAGKSLSVKSFVRELQKLLGESWHSSISSTSPTSTSSFDSITKVDFRQIDATESGMHESKHVSIQFEPTQLACTQNLGRYTMSNIRIFVMGESRDVRQIIHDAGLEAVEDRSSFVKLMDYIHSR